VHLMTRAKTSDGLALRRPGRRAARASDEGGFAMVATMAALMVSTLFVVGAFAAANGDLPTADYDVDKKQAYSAAEAGVANYLFHLNQDNDYWALCTDVPAPSAVNQPWDGAGADPRAWRRVPGSTSEYTIELLPVAGRSSCDVTDAQGSMIDAKSGTFRIRASGRTAGVKRSIVATFKRRGFLDFLYFTDYETSDPTWYELNAMARPTRISATNPTDIVTWAAQNCGNRWWRQGRGSQQYAGQWLVTGFWVDMPVQRCTEIQFVAGDVIAGPLHTNDELLICGNPVFGRPAPFEDRVETSAGKPDSLLPQDLGWRPNGACAVANPVFRGERLPGSPYVNLPPSNSALRQVADPAYRFSGRTTIVLGGASMTVNGVNMALPANGVVYVENGACGVRYKPLDPYNAPAGCADLYLKGDYSKSLTIASEKDIIINGGIQRSGDAMLGLIANNFIRVYHPVNRNPDNPTSCTNAAGVLPGLRIDAAMLSLADSFTVDNYYCGAPMGNLIINGVIAQKYRGPVGRSQGSTQINGYLKQYTYDDRLKFLSPPHFLDPVQAAWRTQRYTEQIPPR